MNFEAWEIFRRVEKFQWWFKAEEKKNVARQWFQFGPMNHYKHLKQGESTRK